MLIVIFSGIISLGLIALVYASASKHEKVLATLGAISLCVIINFAVVLPLIKLTSGLGPNYSQGQRTGNFIKLSYKGVVFKTNEAQLQVSGQGGAFIPPLELSLGNNPYLVEQIESLLAQTPAPTVRVYYHEWLISPVWLAGTSYVVDRIEVLHTTPIPAN